MYCKVQDFISDFKEESQKTLQIFNSLTDSSLAAKVYSEGRNIETICRHIIWSLVDMLKTFGLEEMHHQKDQRFENVQEIVRAYQEQTEKVLNHIPNVISDNQLEDEVEIYGEKWTKKQVLYGFLKHEIHHRAQITVLMRQSGLKVPGIYGPSKEEWKNYGMEPEE